MPSKRQRSVVVCRVMVQVEVDVPEGVNLESFDEDMEERYGDIVRTIEAYGTHIWHSLTDTGKGPLPDYEVTVRTL